MNILFVLENYYPHLGGVEVLFKHVCEGLAKKHEVHVVTHQLKGSKAYEKINGVHVHRVAVPPFLSRYFFTFLCVPKVFSLAKQADIIHTTTYNAAPPASFIGKLLKKPVVITVHEVIGKDWARVLQMNFFSAKLHEFLESIIVHLHYSSLVCVSQSTQKQLHMVRKNAPSTVIYNGIDYDFWNQKAYDKEKVKSLRKKYVKKGESIALFFGRPGPSKGLEYLIRSIPHVIKKHPSFRLIALVSNNAQYVKERERLVQVIKELRIESSVTFLDPVKRPELPLHLLMSDVVVIPSLTEGFGFSCAEACALGKPVIASNTTSLPEVISGEHLLFERANEKALAKSLLQMFAGKARKTPLKKFLWDDCVNGYEKLYKDLKGK